MRCTKCNQRMKCMEYMKCIKLMKCVQCMKFMECVNRMNRAKCTQQHDIFNCRQLVCIGFRSAAADGNTSTAISKGVPIH